MFLVGGAIRGAADDRTTGGRSKRGRLF